MSDKLLFIGIPTYNRAYYLDKSLNSLLPQLKEYEDLVEFCVSDNASTDNTKDVVGKYISAGFKIKYIRHDTTIRSIRHFIGLYKMADTPYVWLVSDDDVPMPNAINRILSILKKSEAGVLHLGSKGYDNDIDHSAYNAEEETRLTRYDEPLKFVDKVNVMLTFMSANIVNKSIIEDKIDMNEFSDCPQIILVWTIAAIFQHKPNYVLENCVLACKLHNTGGYKLYEVFGKETNKILDFFVARGIDRRVKPIIAKHLLAEFFPMFICMSLDRWKRENYFMSLFPIYWKNGLFWKNVVWLSIKMYPRKWRGYIEHWIASIVFKITNSYTYSKISHNYMLGECKKKFKSLGVNSELPVERTIINPQYVTIGNDFRSLRGLRIEAVARYVTGQKFNPELIIGDNVRVGTDVHIECINKVTIGNNVLAGSRVYVTDHLHGDVKKEAVALPLAQRLLVSKGPVVIEDNVLLGEGVCVLPGVVIGKNSIVGANAVVTKSIPPDSVAVGVPAKVIKTTVIR